MLTLVANSSRHPVSDPQHRSRVNQASLREANLSLVLQTIAAAEGPVSRAEVAVETALTRSTVSRLVDALVGGGMVNEVDRVTPTTPGRPATPLVVSGGRYAALGLQVNVSSLAARIVDLRGVVVTEHLEFIDLVASDPAATLARLGAIAAGVIASAPEHLIVVGAGLALPGIVSVEAGTVLRAPNLGWSDVRPAPHLALALGGLSLTVGNEADLAALTIAEPTPGRHGAHRDFIYLSGEIGIGGAFVVGGSVMAGSHGWAAEIGHVCVDPSGPPCPCGSRGCLERYAGRQAMLGNAGMPPTAATADLVARHRAGDPAAMASVNTAGQALGVALAGVINVLDIPIVVLGGHLSQIADLMRLPLEALLLTRVISAQWVAPTVLTAAADPAPGATGAALRELSVLLRNPSAWLDPATATGH